MFESLLFEETFYGHWNYGRRVVSRRIGISLFLLNLLRSDLAYYHLKYHECTIPGIRMVGEDRRAH